MARLVLEKNRELLMITPREEGEGVNKIAKKVAADIQKVSGGSVHYTEEAAMASQAILAVTWGCGSMAEELAEQIPKLRELQGQWETYGFYLVDHPVPGIEAGLVICGSDRLGTIYGLFHLSELLGVTACRFWGDVESKVYDRVELVCGQRIEKNSSGLRIQVKNGNSKEPSVKYRGFFINDEWPCFGNWTFSHFKGFTAEMYDHVFEFLLRMKGNYLWPAMWTSSFLLDGPGMEAMKLADDYGIFIGMSHHEPCMRSSEEWDLVKGEETSYGTEWDYVVNREGLLKYWDDGLKRSKGHNVFPTIGMRGERDSMMLGEDSSIEENIRLLKEIITNQRKLIAKNIHPNLAEVPQLFAVYKEVEDYYFGSGNTEGLRGFKELEDVTLLLCEDNFGNMRALPEAFERKHPGGFGMYFHLDYHGGPCSYEWVNSTPLSKIWEQMTQAYEYGISKLWIVNVGDVKFQEFPLNYFMELAYDFEALGSSAPNQTDRFTREWIWRQFGSFITKDQMKRMAEVVEESVRLNGLRRPESCNSDVYHPAHYGEGERMLKRCEDLEAKNEELQKQLRGTMAESGYYSMIYYPAAASANLLKMHLYAGMNHLFCAQGKAIGNWYGEQMEACINRDERLSMDFARFRDGKWKGMESAYHIGFTNWNSEDWRYPVRHCIRLPKNPRLVVSRAEEETSYTNQYFPVPLPVHDFLMPGTRQVRLLIANGGEGLVEWNIEERSPYFSLSAYEGSTSLQTELCLQPVWSELPLEEEVSWQFSIRFLEEWVPVEVKARKMDLSPVSAGTFVEQADRTVLNAVHFVQKTTVQNHGRPAEFKPLEDYGKQGSGMKVFPVTESFSSCEDAPSLVYQVWAEEEGSRRLTLHTSSANPLVYGGSLELGIGINENKEQILSVTQKGYRGGDHTCSEWAEAVLNQEHTCSLEVYLEKGLNKITVYGLSAGIVLERLVLRKEDKDMKHSYLGPAESYQVME